MHDEVRRELREKLEAFEKRLDPLGNIRKLSVDISDNDEACAVAGIVAAG